MTTASAARSLTERVYASLRADILSGRIAPGQKLKPRDLGAARGVSLNVVREALSRLAGERLVSALPQQGFAVVELSVADLLDLTSARAIVETAALRRSIESGDLRWESGLVAAHHQLAGTPMTGSDCPERVDEPWMGAHNAFHQATMAGCGSTRLLEITASLGETATVYRYWSQRHDKGSRDVAGEHRAIFEAALARDADLACRLHQDHLRRTADIVVAAAAPTDATGPA